MIKFIDDDGFVTRSILCMPVYDSERKITGVTQLINKLNGKPFNENDANIIEVNLCYSKFMLFQRNVDIYTHIFLPNYH